MEQFRLTSLARKVPLRGSNSDKERLTVCAKSAFCQPFAVCGTKVYDCLSYSVSFFLFGVVPNFPLVFNALFPISPFGIKKH